MDEFFAGEYEYKDELEEYTKVTSAHWSREIIEGSTDPPTLQTEKKYERTKVLTSTYGVEMKPFIQTLSHYQKLQKLMIETTEGEHTISIRRIRYRYY